MKIPPEKSERDPLGIERLNFFIDVVKACFHSMPTRVAQYDMLKHYAMYGCGPQGNGTPFNKIEPTVDTLTSFIYGADSTRFSAHFGPEVPAMEWAKAEPISKAINSEWMRCGADQLFSEALDLAMVYNSEFVKLITTKSIVDGSEVISFEPYAVDPHCLGVYREDVQGLDRQEAIAHRYLITMTQLTAMLHSHDKKTEILAAIAPQARRVPDDMPTGLRRILVSQVASATVPGPLTPGQNVSGIADILVADRVDYTPSMPVPMVEMTELWIRDDDLGDWRCVTMVEDQTVVYDRPNIFVPQEQPFTQICPMPLNGYFFGASFVGTLTGLQAWRNMRVEEIQVILARQADPPVAATGFSGMADETLYAIQAPGGKLNNSDPMGKLQRFDEPVPADLWKDLYEIDQMFMEQSGLSPLLMGRGETGVRSGRQTSELSRLGSSRTKKLAMKVEDALETLATKMFRVMQRYDDEEYVTAPLEGGKTPVPFIMNQAPNSTIIKVDAHSNSPLFIEDQRDLAVMLLESRSIERAEFIQMLNTPMKELLLRRLPGIEAKEAAAAKAQMQHEQAMKMAPRGLTAPPQGAANG
jgi:hypothetical protein